jgi:hypothetical protein
VGLARSSFSRWRSAFSLASRIISVMLELSFFCCFFMDWASGTE